MSSSAIDDALPPEAERAFDDERAAPMRVRVAFIATLSLLIWTSQFISYEDQIFTSKLHSYLYRGGELFATVGLLVFVARRRPLRQVQWASAASFSLLAALHGGAILVIRESCVVPFTLTLEWGQIVIALTSLLSFGYALVVLGATFVSGALSTVARAHWDVDLSDHLVLLGIYGVLLMSIRSVDKLRRREFVARTRLDEANQALRKTEEVRSRLFVNLSHDFRTPLALIHGEAELLDHEPREEVRASALERIRAGAASLADLTDELLELARLDAGRTPNDAVNVDLRPLLDEIAAQFQGSASSPLVRVVAPARDDVRPLGVKADIGHVRRILVNLVSNAMRQVRDGRGQVRLAASSDEGHVIVDVMDDGPGLPPERREAIFERFASFDASGSVASGIGLPVAKELAELGGGSLILVEGAPCTTFRVRLPASDGPLAPPAASGKLAPKTTPALPEPALSVSPATNKRRLLVIEDHPDMRRLLKQLLSPAFDVGVVSDCKEARAELARSRPDAILCDVLLPDGDGYEILAHVRKNKALDGVPFLFVSALADVAQRSRGLSAGADDYIPKPFSTEELIARVDSACARADERQRGLEAQAQEFIADLHDGVAASLSRAGLLLTAALRNDDSSSAALAGAREAVNEGLAEARTILSLLDGGASSWEALVADVRRDFDRDARAFSLRPDFRTHNDGSAHLLSSVECHTLRRVAREALTNAVKHASSRAVTCCLEARDGEATLWLEDDGVGIDAAAGRSMGRGLSILERRVKRLGGTIVVGPGSKGGSIVLAKFPLQFRATSDSAAA